jgi:UDP-2,3-diacylglucosamine pyrophosphatase LpxH
MVISTYRIDYKGRPSIKIRPIFDVHYGNQWCDVDAFKRFISEADENTWFIGGGDLLDSIIISDIRRYKKSSDATQSDAIINDSIDGMIEILRPIKDRVIGLGHGNHEENILKYCSTDITRFISTALGIRQLGYSCMTRLLLSYDGGRTRTVVLYQHHGFGGGSRTPGGDLTKYSKHAANYEADIYMYGHVHKRQTEPISRLSIHGRELISAPKHLVICGTFLKTLSDGIPATYAEVGGYPPVSIGGYEIGIKPNDKWVDISVSDV